jgi:hypothetical protein
MDQKKEVRIFVSLLLLGIDIEIENIRQALPIHVLHPSIHPSNKLKSQLLASLHMSDQSSI